LFFNENVVSSRLMMQRYIKNVYCASKREKNFKKIIFLCFALLQNDKYATFVLNVDAFLRL
jgi:hypothetical protein